MKRIYALILVFLMTFSISVFAETNNERLEIFVDIKAEVSGDGSINSPLKTIEEAQSKVREIIASENYPDGGIVVFIREGTYMLADSIYFDEKDSGKENAPVVWRAYYNEDVNITNSASIPLSEFEYSDDERIPEEAQGDVLSYDLRANGLSGHDGLFLGGHSQHYYWNFGFAEPGSPQFGLPSPEVFFGEKTGRLAEYPNNGEWMGVAELVQGPSPRWWINDNDWRPGYENMTYQQMLNTNVAQIFKVNIDKKRMARWAQAKNPWYDSYWRVDWSDFRAPIGKIDPEKQTVQGKLLSRDDPNPEKSRWRIYNLIEELDVPGEWFYDEDNGKVYIFPPAGVKSTDKITLAFQRKNIFDLKNAHDIVIRGFNLTGTRASAVVGEMCNRIEVAYCNISKISEHGINFVNSNNCYFHGNIVKYVGAKGIHAVGGNFEDLTPSNNLIENNYISNFARLQKAYIGGVSIEGVGCTVRNNSISDAPQLAVMFGGNDNIIERNDIHDVLKESADMGAMYTFQNYSCRGNIIRNNAIHDLSSDSNSDIEIFSIYFDNGNSGNSVIGNILYNIDGSGVFMNTGSDMTIKNNIFANMTKNGIYFAAVMGRDSDLKKTFDGADAYKDNPAYAKYPGFVEMFDDPDHWTTTKGNTIVDNIGYNTKNVTNVTLGASKMTMDLLRKFNKYEEGINYTDDPGFLSIENNNYTLLETSKIFESMPSFKEADIDMSKMGTITGMWQHYLGENSLVFKKDSILSYVDFEERLLSQKLRTVDNTTYIPLRYSYEGMDFPVEWDGEKKEININTKLLELKFKHNSAEYIKNGENKILKNKILFENGVTYISAEDFAEITELSLYTTNDGLYIFTKKDLSGAIYDDMLRI